MACGAPVVTSNTSSLPEVAGDATLLADPEDVEAITEAMRRVLADRALAKELQAKGLERAEQFTWERTARETIAVYEKVLGQKIAD
jgi:glycosyltransferase involved in cell wall biosynthesis